MKLQTKVVLSILPLVLLSIIVLDFWAIRVTTDGIEKSTFQHMNTVLDAYVTDKVSGLHNILVKNRLDKEEAFVKDYQLQAARSAEVLKLAETGHIFVLNTSGELVFCSKKKDPRTLESLWGEQAIHIAQGSVTHITGHIHNLHDGYFYVARYFQPWKWVIFYGVSDEEIHTAQEAIRNVTLWIAGLCALASFILIFLVFRTFFVRPVKILQEAASAIAKGETITKIPVYSRDELGDLTRNMEFMSEAIQKHCEEQRGWQAHLETQIEERTKELKESEARYRTVVEDQTEFIVRWLPDGTRIFVNDSYCRYFKQSRDKLIGTSFFSLIVEEDRENIRRKIKSLTSENPVITYEQRTVLPDGTIGWLQWSDRAIFDEQGQIIEYQSVGRDITERKRVEEEAQRGREQIQSIFRAAPIGIGVVKNRIFTFVNQNLIEMLGYSREELLGKNARMVYPNEEEYLRVGKVKYDQIKEKGVGTIETLFQCKNGKIIDVLLSSSPIEPGDLSQGVTFTVLDITERKRAEKQLQQYAVELKDANAELSQYAYAVSHDLQTPLRAIHNYADFLREDLEETLDEGQKAYLDGLNRAVHEANMLIEHILKLSRIGRRDMDIETIEVGPFLQSLIGSLELPDEVKVVMGDDWPTLEVEPILFRQVFQNLISNAVKFSTSPQKQIELGWRAIGEDRYEFSVRDNGIGFDPRHQEKIFRVFERLHTKEEFDGTGIGLAIVKKAVGKLGGSIRVESKPGEGSTFFVILPKTTTNLE